VAQVVERVGRQLKLDVKIGRDVQISPVVNNGKFAFEYRVTGISVASIEDMKLRLAQGGSSFLDYLPFVSPTPPDPNQKCDPVLGLEETKTSGAESRNTGVYQRCTKFVYFDSYYPSHKMIMLYNIRGEDNEKPPQTIIFGTKMLMNLGVEVLGKELDGESGKRFESVDELIAFKKAMRPPPGSNVPIDLSKFADKITISGRLFKAGSLSHDPNIGALTIISKTLRLLGWNKRIVITKHGLQQEHLHAGNKFVIVANLLKVELDGLKLPVAPLPPRYWAYSTESEKNATILLHQACENAQVGILYDNHAGSERGYFISNAGEPITVHKYRDNIKANGIVSLPDLVIGDHKRKQIALLEGKRVELTDVAISSLANLDPFEKEYVQKEYPGYKTMRGVVSFGGKPGGSYPAEVFFHLADDGTMTVTKSAPLVIHEVINGL
jgi:hypothetical protein